MYFTMILDSNILIGSLAVLILVLTIDIMALRFKMRKMLRNGTTKDLGEAMVMIDGDVKKLESFRKEIELYLLDVEKRIRRSTQAAETVRFNAFRGDGTGGNQSFATALVSQNGDGVILSSLYSRDRVSVFSKPVSKFASDIELSEEEKRAMSLAKSKLEKDIHKA